MKLLALTLAACAALAACDGDGNRGVTLLNVSYDPTRELDAEIDAAFVAAWKQQTGQTVTIENLRPPSAAIVMADSPAPITGIETAARIASMP